MHVIFPVLLPCPSVSVPWVAHSPNGQVATIKHACGQQASADRPSMESVKGTLNMLGAVGGEAKPRQSRTAYPAMVLPPSASGPYEAAAAADIRAPSVHHLYNDFDIILSQKKGSTREKPRGKKHISGLAGSA